jgi:nicotinamide riboside transporter PnuC
MLITITFGTKFMGKVDDVGDFLWVETKFHHVFFAPVIPVQSWIVMRERNGGGVAQIKIPTSLKSVAVAWMWYVGIIAGVVGLVGGAEMYLQNAENWEIWVLTGVVGAMFFAAAGPWSALRKASYARACELAKALKLNDETMAHIAESYGRRAPKPTAIAHSQ